MITAGAASVAPRTWRWRRWLRRGRAGGSRIAATGAPTPAAASPVPPPGGACLLVIACSSPSRDARSGALVDQRLRGLLAGRLGLLDVAGEHGLVDHLGPRPVVVIEDRVLDHAVGRLALGHHVAEQLVPRIERRVDLVDQVGADGDDPLLGEYGLRRLVGGPLDELLRRGLVLGAGGDGDLVAAGERRGPAVLAGKRRDAEADLRGLEGGDGEGAQRRHPQ